MKPMATLFEVMNSKETNNIILFKRKVIAFLKTQEAKDVFNKTSKIDSVYTVVVKTDAHKISLTTDSTCLGDQEEGRFWLKITDRKKLIPLNNVLLEIYMDVPIRKIKIKKYKSLKLNPDTALDYFKKVVGTM